MGGELRLSYLINAVIYAAVGLGLFCLAFVVIDRLTPYHLWNQIVDKQNVALAILLGAMSIGMCVIIASAVH